MFEVRHNYDQWSSEGHRNAEYVVGVYATREEAEAAAANIGDPTSHRRGGSDRVSIRDITPSPAEQELLDDYATIQAASDALAAPKKTDPRLTIYLQPDLKARLEAEVRRQRKETGDAVSPSSVMQQALRLLLDAKEAGPNP